MVGGGVVVGGGFCDFRAKPALTAMIRRWSWGRPEQFEKWRKTFYFFEVFKSLFGGGLPQ